MRPSLRFLAVAVVGWVGVRAATLDALPGAEIFRIQRSEAKPPPPVIPTEFPPIEPLAPVAEYAPETLQYAPAPQAIPVRFQPVTVPVYYTPVELPAPPRRLTPILPEPRPAFYGPIPVLDDSPLSRIAATSIPPRRSTVAVQSQSVPAPIVANKLDRACG